MRGVYYKFVSLSDEVRASNKIRSKARLDCISFIDEVQGGYKGVEPFINKKTFKGQLYFYKTPARDIVKADSKRIAEWSLSNGDLNFSSIYFEDFDFPEYAYGYPNPDRLLKNGTLNPLFPFRNDGYLFIVNKDFSEIEIIVFPDSRNLISSYYHKLIDSGFNDDLKRFREQAKPFYNYLGIAI